MAAALAALAGPALAGSGIDDKGFVREWLVLAPIPFPHVATGTAELAARQIPNEATMRPLAGQYVKLVGRELVWQEHHAPEPAIDFAKYSNEGRALESIAYAVAYLVAAEAQPALQLKMGSSKQAKVYVNGKPLLAHAEPRPYKADQDAAPLSLKKGPNVVVFKVVNTGGAWRGSLRLVDGAGQPPRGVQVALHPRLDAADLFPLDGQGYVRNWLLLAPIAYVPPTVGKGVAGKPLLANEAALRPAAGDKVFVASARKELAWQPVSAKDFFVDIAAAAGPGEHRAVAGYAVSYVVAPAALTGLKLKTGSNDQGRVYLNGKPVVTFDAPRGLRPDQDVVGGITLRKGVNVVVFKVLNTEFKWQACLRFTDAQDQPVTTLSATIAPPPL